MLYRIGGDGSAEVDRVVVAWVLIFHIGGFPLSSISVFSSEKYVSTLILTKSIAEHTHRHTLFQDKKCSLCSSRLLQRDRTNSEDSAPKIVIGDVTLCLRKDLGQLHILSDFAAEHCLRSQKVQMEGR